MCLFSFHNNLTTNRQVFAKPILQRKTSNEFSSNEQFSKAQKFSYNAGKFFGRKGIQNRSYHWHVSSVNSNGMVVLMSTLLNQKNFKFIYYFS